MFTADADAAYFFGGAFNLLGYGLEQRYQSRQIWRWKGGSPPAFRPNTQRNVDNSCHGEDENGDGFPELATCISDLGKCIDPEFTQDPNEPVLGYRLYVLTQIGPGQLEVLHEEAVMEGIPLCQFSGGGLDCTVMAELSAISEPFPTAEEAVLSMCIGVANLRILPLGVGPALEFFGEYRYASYTVYGILQGCP